MIVYLDASALVKRYVAERGSASVNDLITKAAIVGTATISRAETAAALAKATRVGALTRNEGKAALQVFYSEWLDLIRLQLTEPILDQAGALAWEYGLRGYDAVHLATARLWQSSMGEPVILATFDRQLWEAGATAGLVAWPEEMSDR
ncbi:MAG: type II toxin-antitoxin system VapC family toxin [Anaerolineales bacterium]|nr:type II toxin-antitoxin system VapC family toxin [Anaerolineales bacterium]